MIQPGNNNAASIAEMTGPELVAEAMRLANNCGLTGMEYTAAVIARLCEMVGGK